MWTYDIKLRVLQSYLNGFGIDLVYYIKQSDYVLVAKLNSITYFWNQYNKSSHYIL